MSNLPPRGHGYRAVEPNGKKPDENSAFVVAMVAIILALALVGLGTIMVLALRSVG